MEIISRLLIQLLEALVLSIRSIVPRLLVIAFYTVCERKIIRSIQRRRGPTEVGRWGLLQAIADGVKLVFKEVIMPIKRHFLFFFFAPVFIFSISLVSWAFLPTSMIALIDSKYSLLRILALSSLGVYGIIFAGWSSGSRYPFLGGVRAAAQLISYELAITLTVFTVAVTRSTLNLYEIIEFQSKLWLCVPFFPLFLMFVITGLAETNRTPFDLPEAEAELVAGYNLEYSSIPFRLFFLREYCNMIIMSVLTVVLFVGGWDYFLFKVLFFMVLYIVIRARLPRLRYDQLIELGWNILLPIVLSYFIFVIIRLLVLNDVYFIRDFFKIVLSVCTPERIYIGGL